MAIHPEADAIYFADHPRQRGPALALGEAFDISYGREHKDLSFWIAAPDANTAERFGLTREVLVVHSGHRQTDARVLTAIDDISKSPEFRNRLDQTLAILVHAGDEEETAGLITPTQTDDPDRGDRVIVPMRISELTDPHRGDMFVRSAIARALGGADLFGMSSPVTSERYFFGRHDLVRNLVTRALVHKQNSGLFGLRKTGKTSVLYAALRTLNGQPVRSVYVDCSNPGLYSRRWWETLQQIASRCGLSEGGDEPYQPQSAGQLFADAVRRELSRDTSAVLVMLDEIEFITQGLSGTLGAHWDEDFLPFWQTMRAAHQESQGRFTFIVAGVNPASVEKPHFGDVPNPVFQLALPQYLEPLTVDGVRSMVRTIGRYSGLQFDEPVYAYLQQAYGGHPYLIRIACSEVWRSVATTDPIVRTRVSVSILDGLTANIRVRLAQPIRDMLLSLVWWYPDEYGLLQILAAGDSSFVQEYVTANPEAMIQFARYGLLREDSDFAIDAVRMFLREHGDDYKRQLSPFARGDMPPDLLPEVLDIETLGDLFQKRTEVEDGLRRAILLHVGAAYGWDGVRVAREIVKVLPVLAERPDPSQLFVGRNAGVAITELYTSDLKAIVVARWDLFEALFDRNKARFEMNADTMNVARRVDAHTRPFTRAELTDFSNSYAWLSNRLARVGGV